MIKATARDRHGNPVVLLGLTRVNIDRMRKDQPVRVQLEELGLPPTTVFVFTGDTEEQMLADLQGAASIGQLIDTKTPYVNQQQEIARRLRDKLHYIDIGRHTDEAQWLEVVETVMTLAAETAD